MTAAIIGTRAECERAIASGEVWDGRRVVPVRVVSRPRWHRAFGQWRVDFEVEPR